MTPKQSAKFELSSGPAYGHGTYIVTDVSSDSTWHPVVCVERRSVDGKLCSAVNHVTKEFAQVCAALEAKGAVSMGRKD